MRVDNCATGVRAYTDVETGERMFERSRTDSCVAAANDVVMKRGMTDGRIAGTDGV